MSFPTAEDAAIFAGILDRLGWKVPYQVHEFKAAITEYLESSDVAPEDYRSVHTNFLHTAVDHCDILKACYGAKSVLSYGEDGQTPTITFYPYSPS